MQLDAQPDETPGAALAARLNEAAQRIIAGVEDTLGIRVRDLDKSFVELGGDSLSYVRMSMILEDQLGQLPAAWEREPLQDLIRLANQNTGTPASSRWARMDATVLFRAIAIFIVALSHTGNLTFLSATSPLFVISGINFGKFLRPGIRSTGSLGPTAQFIARFAIPAGLWEAFRGLTLHHFWLPDLLLLGTFFQNPAAPHFTFWFLDVLAANVLLLALIAKLGFWLRGKATAGKDGHESLFRADLLCCLAGLAIAFAQVSTGWWEGNAGSTSVAPFKWFWMLVLGLLIAQAETRARRCMLTGFLACLISAAYSNLPFITPLFGETDALFFASALALVWVDRLPVPRVLQRPVMAVASATLFIYIVNYSVMTKLLPALGSPDWWPLQVGAAIAAGIVAKSAWDRLARWTTKLTAFILARLPVAGRLVSRILPKSTPYFAPKPAVSGA
ncbi:MAG: acyl carrier protein, partial [Rhodospirillales bacterium]|nr:acyl carrier protein [Acetobacter sp.]